jgi:hypothetical protein
MTLLIILFIIIAVAAFCYNIFLQISIQRIEKHLSAPLFWTTLIFMSIVPVFWKLRNTSATVLASRANVCLCIFYMSIAIIILLAL